jgi:hypothetical protein
MFVEEVAAEGPTIAEGIDVAFAVALGEGLGASLVEGSKAGVEGLFGSGEVASLLLRGCLRIRR